MLALWIFIPLFVTAKSSDISLNKTLNVIQFSFNIILTALINVPNWVIASSMTLIAKLPCPAKQLLRSGGGHNPVAEN